MYVFITLPKGGTSRRPLISKLTCIQNGLDFRVRKPDIAQQEFKSFSTQKSPTLDRGSTSRPMLRHGQLTIRPTQSSNHPLIQSPLNS